ncbi:MAG: GxxExxY protein, partial [Deltaproteobacteria bacterium]|nr:GxxExxY protein [Deltaproteobacteria bacterium]
MKSQDEIFALCDRIRETSFELHRYLRHGHLEKVYENGLANRLRKKGMHVEQQYPLKVFDEDGTVLGDYFADLLVEKELIVELKATRV